jgi:class 3 adenylate cyclase
MPPLWERFVPVNALAHLRRLRNGKVPEKTLREVAVLFIDIEGCTRLCEDLSPHAMNDVIEAYFSRYLDVIRRSGGDVIELLGDGLLALFEGPDTAQNIRSALAAALHIRAHTHALNQRRRRRHDPITVNIGMNAGRALVGFTRLRSRAGERYTYAATGPVTNVAARLCALATRGQILTTSATADLVPSGCDSLSLGPQRLKNVTGHVEVVEIRPGTVVARQPSNHNRRKLPDD